jgi:hypothetical protein
LVLISRRSRPDKTARQVLEEVRDLGTGKLALTASPADWRDQWTYFLMIDRFNNTAAAESSAV